MENRFSSLFNCGNQNDGEKRRHLPHDSGRQKECEQLARATPFADSLDFWCSSELLSHVPEWCQHLSGQRQSVRLVVGRTLLVVFTFLLVAKAPSLQLYHR